MGAIILDCSVAISWLLPDESFDSNILKHVTKQGAIVPMLWFLEVGNVLLIAQRRKRIKSKQRQEALVMLSQLPITADAFTAQHAWHKTSELANQHDLTLYDASYLELALRLKHKLATYDKALIKAAQQLSIEVITS